LKTGDVVEIWRPFKLKHPVTGKVMSDRFRIGTLELRQVRNAMSMARPKGQLERGAEKGDVIIASLAGAPAVKQPAPLPAASAAPLAAAENSPAKVSTPPGPPVNVETLELSTLVESLRGADLRTRIERYEQFIRARPQSRYAATLYEE